MFKERGYYLPWIARVTRRTCRGTYCVCVSPPFPCRFNERDPAPSATTRALANYTAGLCFGIIICGQYGATAASGATSDFYERLRVIVSRKSRASVRRREPSARSEVHREARVRVASSYPLYTRLRRVERNCRSGDSYQTRNCRNWNPRSELFTVTRRSDDPTRELLRRIMERLSKSVLTSARCG